MEGMTRVQAAWTAFWETEPQVLPPLALVVKNPPTIAEDVRDEGLIPASERSPGGEDGNPLQYSCLENSMDRGVHGVAESDTTEATWHACPGLSSQKCASLCFLPGEATDCVTYCRKHE